MSKVQAWVVDRFALQPIYDRLLDRRVPKAHWYVGDGTTLLTLLGLQVLTGAVLALTYSPSTDGAYQSVSYISETQFLGWFIRGLHYWSAGLMVVVLFYHLFRQILIGGYKAPREGTWIIGVLMFFGVLLLAYTGYLLRWDERAVHGVRVMIHMLTRVPLIGTSLAVFVQGGDDIGPQTLTRLYATHVLIIPLKLFLLTGLHLYLIVQRGTVTHTEKKQGAATAEEQKAIYKEEVASELGESFFPFTMFKTGLMAGGVVAIILATTLFRGPPPLMPEGNLDQVSMPAEEWWFWWLSGLIALLPPAVAPWFIVLLPIAAFVVLMAFPFVDRGPYRGIRRRPIILVVVTLIVLSMLALSDYRRRSDFTGWPKPEPPEVTRVTLSPEAEHGRQLFATYGCNSCHAVGGQGRKFAVDFAEMPAVRSRDHIRKYILQPPTGIAMPAYDGRLTEEELEGLTAFCHVAQTFRRRPN